MRLCHIESEIRRNLERRGYSTEDIDNAEVFFIGNGSLLTVSAVDRFSPGVEAYYRGRLDVVVKLES